MEITNLFPDVPRKIMLNKMKANGLIEHGRQQIAGAVRQDAKEK